MKMDWEPIERDMQIPSAYRLKLFSNFDYAFNKQKIKSEDVERAARNRKWIILSGADPGVGKTHLAVAAMKLSWRTDRVWDSFRERKVLPDAGRYRFVSMRDWGPTILSAGYRAEDVWGETVNGCRCLLLDDLGFEPERCDFCVSRLIDDYYRRQCQLIITTNLDAEQLVRRYGGAIVDRIIGQASRIIELTGKSYRQKE